MSLEQSLELIPVFSLSLVDLVHEDIDPGSLLREIISSHLLPLFHLHIWAFFYLLFFEGLQFLFFDGRVVSILLCYFDLKLLGFLFLPFLGPLSLFLPGSFLCGEGVPAHDNIIIQNLQSITYSDAPG